jgi:multidrug efflux pump subunit AcrB
MTSLAFLFGVLPLAFSTGAGAASRNAIGIGVAGGLLAATFLVILFVPVFFVVVLSLFGKQKFGKHKSAPSADSTAPAH